MAFNTAITGIKASQIELDVTGNNIANTSTVGYKSARTEFSDIFTTVVVGAGSTNNPGAGVIVSDIAQDFTAGTIEFTNSNLDLAIDGSGFFQLDDGQGGTTYTRAGGFELDKDGNVVSKTGKFLQGYGLDDAGNQQPIGTLAVSQSESPPEATTELDLSFNIDSRDDASTLVRPYDPDDSATFTFSTTTRTFDSLGNEHTLKFDLVEQPPFRERQTIALTNTATATGNIEFAGATISITNGDTPAQVATKIAAAESTIRTSDSRISSVAVDPNNSSQLLVTYFASATDVEPLVYTDRGTTGVTATVSSDPDVASNEQQAVSISQPGGAGAIDFGGVQIAVDNASVPPDTATDVINRIVANQAAILVANPQIESLSADLTNSQVVINYKPEEGNVGLLSIDDSGTGVFDTQEQQTINVSGATGAGTLTINLGAVVNGLGIADPTVALTGSETATQVGDAIVAAFAAIPDITVTNSSGALTLAYNGSLGNVDNIAVTAGTTGVAGSGQANTVAYANVTTAAGVEDGDNTYEGVYQLYAYLNGEDLLDIGKQVAPGEVGSTSTPPLTEPGAILLTFDNTNGVLNTVNGTAVSGGGLAPALTIQGADPADPAVTIELDLTDTTQFASESIVKSAQQDGFAKGDLIGVTFSPDGTMVASFSNGQNTNLGIVALATFENQQGLQSVGDTEWSATLESGQAVINPPGTGLNGQLRSAALEQSNVDLSEELVALIEAQRNFQANSKTLETENAVTQTILQIT
ncbi:MAG: flagellar hook-basal body complex protein [Motiliproteus sp.]|nr:flagellar hook-basal body complex protein [Motiliproteus sp.]MCW9051985.1 flagellar hook-basal body complex protein [Motiliproteus sp.]